MFWTRYTADGSVNRAWMDGSNKSQIVRGLNRPSGITIDFQYSRLYWVCTHENKVQSSDMQGQDFKTLVHLSVGMPRGIGVQGDRIYWATWGTGNLESSNKFGQDIQTVYDGQAELFQMTVAPRPDLSTTRENHCQNADCSKVCVLTPTAYTCL